MGVRAAAEAKDIDARAVGRPRGEHRPRRFRPHAAGAVEPVLQRGQVHAARGARRDLGRARRQPGPRHRERHRPGHRRGVPAPRLRALPPGRGLEQPTPSPGSAWGSPSCASWSSCTAERSRAESAGKDQGATFTVVLPIPALLQTPPASEPAVTSAAAGGASDAAGPGARHPGRRERARRRRRGRRARRARGPPRAVRRARCAPPLRWPRRWPPWRRHVPDVLVSDLGMPGEDGYELIRQGEAPAAEAVAALPSLAVSAYATEEHRQKVLRTGFQRPPREAGGPRRAGDRGGPGRGPRQRQLRRPRHRLQSPDSRKRAPPHAAKQRGCGLSG